VVFGNISELERQIQTLLEEVGILREHAERHGASTVIDDLFDVYGAVSEARGITSNFS
jgi:regulator of replication initiation timing